jgi:hypothetical protein
MNIDNLVSTASDEAAVKNNLLLPGQVAYNLGLNQFVGSQKKVIYNAMGPDISTVLYLTDPDEIIGIDENGVSMLGIDYVLDGEGVDKLEIISEPVYSKSHYFRGDKRSPRFNEDLKHRREKGYWDLGDLARWGVNQLFLIELNRLGVEEYSIKDIDLARSIHIIKNLFQNGI